MFASSAGVDLREGSGVCTHPFFQPQTGRGASSAGADEICQSIGFTVKAFLCDAN